MVRLYVIFLRHFIKLARRARLKFSDYNKHIRGTNFMPTRSFVKLIGPPILKGIRKLEEIAVGMPEVCILDTIIANTPEYSRGRMQYSFDPDFTAQYFENIPIEIGVERCDTIISKSGEILGDYDFFFEWFKDPTMDQLNHLIEKIDEALTTIGCRYTVITKK